MQKKILFPTNAISPVAKDWHPEGNQSEQALIDGNCGNLHMAIWRTPQAKGTIMMFHGNGESLSSIGRYVGAFHALGYNLMTWDYPGYGQSSDCSFSQPMLLEDAETAYQWLSEKENPKDIFLFGYSLGTGLALSVAAKHQDNPIFLVAGYDALSHVAQDRFSDLLPIDLLFKFPMQTQQWVEAIQKPIYLIHGTNDQQILPKRANALVKNSRGKVKVEWVKSADHTSEKLFAFRNQWLKRLLP